MQRHHIASRLEDAIEAESALRNARDRCQDGWIHPERSSIANTMLDCLERALEPLYRKARDESAKAYDRSRPSSETRKISDRIFRPARRAERAALAFVCEGLPRPAVPGTTGDREYKIARWNNHGYVTKDHCIRLFASSVQRAEGAVKALRVARDGTAADGENIAAELPVDLEDAERLLKDRRNAASVLYHARDLCQQGCGDQAGRGDIDQTVGDCANEALRWRAEAMSKFAANIGARPGDARWAEIEADRAAVFASKTAVFKALAASLPGSADAPNADDCQAAVSQWNAQEAVTQNDCMDLLMRAYDYMVGQRTTLTSYCARLREVMPAPAELERSRRRRPIAVSLTTFHAIRRWRPAHRTHPRHRRSKASS